MAHTQTSWFEKNRIGATFILVATAFLCAAVVVMAIALQQNHRTQQAQHRQSQQEQARIEAAIKANQRKSDQRFCATFKLLIGPSSTPPTTDRGALLARQFRTLYQQFDCVSKQ
jgi:Flp pilus assembly protein TadB